MKTIVTPAPCVVILGNAPTEFTLALLVRDTLCADQRWGASLRSVQRSVRLIAAFEAATPDSTLDIDDEDHAILLECCEQPSAPFNPAIARHLLPLFEAITKARDKVPAALASDKKRAKP